MSVSYLALGNLLDLESSVGYAKSKGTPLASVTVPLGSLGLIAGALAVLVGVYPALGGLAVVGYLVPVTAVSYPPESAPGRRRWRRRSAGAASGERSSGVAPPGAGR